MFIFDRSIRRAARFFDFFAKARNAIDFAFEFFQGGFARGGKRSFGFAMKAHHFHGGGIDRDGRTPVGIGQQPRFSRRRHVAGRGKFDDKFEKRHALGRMRARPIASPLALYRSSNLDSCR